MDWDADTKQGAFFYISEALTPGLSLHISIHWQPVPLIHDLTKFRTPKGCDPHALAQNVRSALVKLHYNSLVSIYAYSDTNHIPVFLRSRRSPASISASLVVMFPPLWKTQVTGGYWLTRSFGRWIILLQLVSHWFLMTEFFLMLSTNREWRDGDSSSA